MKREKTPVCTSVAELLSVIEKEASQMEELARSIEGTYTRHIGYCELGEGSVLTTVVTYVGLEYTEKQGIRAILRFQDTKVQDIDGKTSNGDRTIKYRMEGLQWIVDRYKNDCENVWGF